ncbi:MAG: DedA family protein [Chloroflexota bacterium]|nr:DedA family protein [Chloroflexota bacterium]MDE2841106.1 DedA family protein [Chloroflexota bacterium]MDE2930336.1 DedA family protein [Chloroflexota bacterium]
MDLLHDLVDWVLAWSESPYGGLALFVLSAAESIIFPVPPDPLLIALGVGKPSFALVFAAICLAGSLVGASIGYLIGMWGGRPVVDRLFSQEKIEFVERKYQRYDVWAILIAALTPIPYKVFTVTAGMFRLHFGRFMLASLLGRGARFFAVGLLIALFGEPIKDFIDQYLDILFIVFMVLLVGGFFVIRLLTRTGKSAESDGTAA